MFTQTKFGMIQLIKNPIPLRHAKKGLSITEAYFRLCNSIELARKAPSTHKSITRASNTLIKLGLLYEGENIIRLFEKWFVSPVQVASVQTVWSEDTISRDEYEQMRISRILQLSTDLDDCILFAEAVLIDASCEFDFVHYDKEFKKIIWFHLAYDIAEDLQLFEKWKEGSQQTAPRLAAIASQYYGAEVKKIEIACIDPLLEWSRDNIGLWSIDDADLFTGKTEIAEEFTAWRSDFRRKQYKLIDNSAVFNEDEYMNTIIEKLQDFVIVARRDCFKPDLRVLTPGA